MIFLKSKEECSGCFACYSICPQKCIEMKEDEEGYLYPFVNRKECINCNLCEKVCPTINKISTEKVLKSYAAYNKNEYIRINSSSGGIFSLIAENILQQGGIVFGACFDNEFNVIHDYIEKEEEIEKFRGSKYVQSIIGENLKQAKIFLENGKKVLFVGTPCQIAGLKSFLNKDYDNLITIDIICHGVPSKKVWQKYKSYISKGRNIKSVNFRDKSFGWKKYSLKVEFDNEDIFSELNLNNSYIQGFVNDFYLRPSCYSCKEKGKKRISDITLGDLWGIDNIIENFGDEKGVSMIFINSQKGQYIMDSLKGNMEFDEIDYEEVIKYNPSIINNPEKNKKRDSFFKYLKNNSFEDSLEMSVINKKSVLFKFIVKNNLKKVINLLYDKKENLKIKYYNIFIKFYSKPKLYSMIDTIDLLEKGYSISRYGDGEFNLIYGNDISFQKYDDNISNRLMNILSLEQPNLLVALPNTFGNLDYLNSDAEYFWKKYMIINRKKIMSLLDTKRKYGDSFITRFYLSYKDKSSCSDIINRYKIIWNNKDIVIVEGELTRLGIGNDLFDNCKSIRRILCPSTNAFDKYDVILKECKKMDKEILFILAIGPTATVLAADLCNLGYQALDLGHIDIQYEYFLRGVNEKIKIKGKYVNEVRDGYIVDDMELKEMDIYAKQILINIK